MEMYLDDSSSERKIIWHILKVGIPLELLKPLSASSLPGARSRGRKGDEVAAGGAADLKKTTVPSNFKAIFYRKKFALIEGLPVTCKLSFHVSRHGVIALVRSY